MLALLMSHAVKLENVEKTADMLIELMPLMFIPAGVVISLLAYGAGVFLRRKTKSDLCNPLLISIAIVIVFLLVFRIDYASYNRSAQYLSYLLTPATVALAVPLYRQMDMLKKNLGAVLLAILTGVFGNMVIEPICRLFAIHNPISKGLAAGTASHAIGTAKAMEMGEIEGAMSSLAIVVSGLITVVCASLFAGMY